MTYYYGTRTEPDGSYRGVVYHYDSAGEVEIFLYKSASYEDDGAAIDDAAEWADDNGYDVEME